MNSFLLKIQKKKNLFFFLFFFSFMLIQLVVLRLGNQAGRGYLPETLQERVYCFLQIAVIVGFLLHALLYKFLKTKKGTVGRLSALCICAVGTGILFFSPEDSVFYLVVTAVCVLFLGFVCGEVYSSMALWISDGVRPGICLGCGYAAAIALQYALQLRWTVRPLLAVSLLLCFILLALCFLIGDKENSSPSGETTDNRPVVKVVCAVVITLAMLIFINYYNTYIHHLQIVSGYTDYNVYAWPRLLMIPGMILFGWIGDIKKGRFLPISALCISVVAFLNILLIGKETNLLNMCLYYLSLTAAVSFYHMTFLRLAASARLPAPLAGTGRILDSAVVLLSVILGFSDFPPVAVLVIDIAALVVIIVFMAVGGDFNLSEAAQSKVPAAETEADPLLSLRERFGLTPSELKVLRELVTTDDKQEAIAGRLRISVSTVRHHITSIYKKTGVQTRTALCRLAAGNE